MEAHLHEESKLWSFLVLFQKPKQECKEEKQKEESNMKKSKRTASAGHILSTFWSSFYTYYISFRSLGSYKFNALNGVRIRAETKKLWPFEDNHTKLSENFAAAKSACENFAVVKPPAGTRVPLCKFKFHFSSCESSCEIISKSRNHLQVVKSQIQLAKWTILTCKIFTSCIWTCKIHLCNLKYLWPTQLDFLLKIFCVNFYFSPCKNLKILLGYLGYLKGG